MPDDKVGTNRGKRGTNQFMRMGHTAGPVGGADPNVNPKGKAAASPRELKP